jgi:phage terminase small subunit
LWLFFSFARKEVNLMAELRNKKHELFVQEYLVDLNQTQAAIRAGYSPISASQTASEIMANPKVRTRVEELRAERSKRTGVNADRVVQELARIAFVNPTEVVNAKDATLKEDADEDDTAAIASVKVKIVDGDFSSVEREIKFADKLKALELLGKHLGMFTDNVKLTGDVGVTIVNDIPRKTDG